MSCDLDKGYLDCHIFCYGEEDYKIITSTTNKTISVIIIILILLMTITTMTTIKQNIFKIEM